MEVSTHRYSGAAGLRPRSPLLRLQPDDRLVSMIRGGNQAAFEVLVSRYHARLLSFCRHLLGSREDAEDVLQDVLAAAYRAMLADERALNVKPWLYRIARNRCLNQLRRNTPIGMDSMDVHLSDHGASTADRVHEREEFRLLVSDIGDLPETQRTALILREMDALSYEQIAEAMETTVSSVKSLLVRARVSLTESAEARLLSCDQVREELAEVAEGLRRKASAPVRRHVKNCSRCGVFAKQMRKTDRALAALIPLGPLALLRKAIFAHLVGHSAVGSASAGGAGAAGGVSAGAGGAVSAGAAGAATAAGAGSGGFITAGVGAVATKAAAGLAAAALVTAGTVAVSHHSAATGHGVSATTVVNRAVEDGIAQAASNDAGVVGAVSDVPTVAAPRSRPSASARRHPAAGAVRRQAPAVAVPAVGSTAVPNSAAPAPVTSPTAVDPTSVALEVAPADQSSAAASVQPPTGGVSPPAAPAASPPLAATSAEATTATATATTPEATPANTAPTPSTPTATVPATPPAPAATPMPATPTPATATPAATTPAPATPTPAAPTPATATATPTPTTPTPATATTPTPAAPAPEPAVPATPAPTPTPGLTTSTSSSPGTPPSS